MSPPNSILRQYQIIANISTKMLSQARLSQWDLVVALGEQYKHEVESLRDMTPMTIPDRYVRKDLLAQILSNDAHIRNLAMPELARLDSLLGNMKRQQSVLRTYSSSSTPNS